MARPRALALLACSLLSNAQPPNFETPAKLDEFFFPSEQENVVESLKIAFHFEHAGTLVTTAAKMGPAYAIGVAAAIPSREFRQSYQDLAKYLELFGPCQKKQMGEAGGWWSAYGESPGEVHCSEVTKLIAGNMLWSQVHYCRQLTTGEVQPKVAVPPGKGPPWRLDEPPVKSPWLKADALYALADAAVGFRFHETLKKRAEPVGAQQEALRQAYLAAAAEIENQKPSRELVALALAKILIREYEALHLGHLEAFQRKSAK